MNSCDCGKTWDDGAEFYDDVCDDCAKKQRSILMSSRLEGRIMDKDKVPYDEIADLIDWDSRKKALEEAWLRGREIL